MSKLGTVVEAVFDAGAGSREIHNYDRPYRLLEESRKSWNHTISHEIVYSLDPLEVALDSEEGIAKDYLEGHVWIEVHITLESGLHGEGKAHYAAILEAYTPKDAFRQMEIKDSTMRRNPHVFVDVAHLVETPEEVAFLTAARSPRL